MPTPPKSFAYLDLRAHGNPDVATLLNMRRYGHEYQDLLYPYTLLVAGRVRWHNEITRQRLITWRMMSPTPARNAGHVLVAGDLNSRVGHRSPLHLPPDLHPAAPLQGENRVDPHGKALLQACRDDDLVLCSGSSHAPPPARAPKRSGVFDHRPYPARVCCYERMLRPLTSAHLTLRHTTKTSTPSA